MRNSFLGLVAHVGEAEGFAFDFAVTAVDDQMVFGAQVAHESCDVNAAAVSDAGEGLRAEAVLGEEVEAGATDPIVDQRVGFDVALVTIRQAFSENIVEL